MVAITGPPRLVMNSTILVLIGLVSGLSKVWMAVSKLVTSTLLVWTKTARIKKLAKKQLAFNKCVLFLLAN